MTESSEKVLQCLIIGSGPAGLSAALYAARADLAPVVLSGMDLGGQVSKTDAIENYPGFLMVLKVLTWLTYFQKQAERFGAEIVFDSATEVDLSERPFKVTTYSGEYLAETLIIATGALSANWAYLEKPSLLDGVFPTAQPATGISSKRKI